MRKFPLHRVAALVAVTCLLALGSGVRAASVYNVIVTPGQVPDAQPPRIAPDAPTPQFGPDSWMNSATGKVNVYVSPEQLFGRSLTIQEVASISYWTKAPVGQENWYINVYTKPQSGGDTNWYGQRFFNSDYTSYASDGVWHQHTLGPITRSSGSGGAYANFAAWQSAYGGNSILAFSPQTNSGLNGNEAQIDGMTITLANGDIGNVNFAAVVPVPAALPAGLAVFGLIAVKRRFFKRAAA